MILSLNEVMDISQCYPDREHFARAIEAKVLEKLHKQVLEEICFKMAGGSPNRERIHRLIDTWVGGRNDSF